MTTTHDVSHWITVGYLANVLTLLMRIQGRRDTMSFSKNVAKQSKRWRGALICLALFGAIPVSFGSETRYVSTYDDLKAAISEFNENTAQDYQIVLKNNIVLNDNLPMITGNASLKGENSGVLVIEGNGYSIDGNNTYRGLIIDTKESGSQVTVDGVEFLSCYAAGGNGGDGASGGGGGLGAGAAIYAYSGDIVLRNVVAANSTVKGGDGGSVLQGSESYGAGGGLGGDGGNGVIGETGAANGGGVFANGTDSTIAASAGDGGVTSSTSPDSMAHNLDTTSPVGGDSLQGGGGGASVAVGGSGGFGGGGGAGGVQGGVGGFGGGGGGSTADLQSGVSGFGAGNGGYVEPVTSEIFSDTQGGGTGGGGAALGSAIFVGSSANVTIAVDENSFGEIYGGSYIAGLGGGGTATDGETIGKGIFLLNDLAIEVAEGGTYYISDSIGGYAGSRSALVDADGNYENESGVVKSGEGTLYLNAEDSSYTGNTTVEGGTLVANQLGAISPFSNLDVKDGVVLLNANQSVQGLDGGENGEVQLNGNTLSVTGSGDSAYEGVITGKGTLLKTGTGKLALSGDSRSDSDTFTTELRSGTIQTLSDGALGSGTIYYSRTDKNDQTPAIEFANDVNIASDIVLSGNSVPLILSGSSGTLSGRLSANNSNANEIVLRLDEGEALTLTNTSVVTDDEGTHSNGLGNSVYSYRLESGDLIAKVDSFATEVGDLALRYWYSSIGNASITNAGDNKLTFLLNTDDSDGGLKFSNNMVMESGWLTLSETILDGDVSHVGSVYYGGSTSGNGGFRVDVGNGTTVFASGSFGHGYTDIASGTFDVSHSSDNTVFLGGLSSDGNGTLAVGSKTINVGFNNADLTFDGRIVADEEGANIIKTGNGSWTLNLMDDSNVKSIDIASGSFSLGENHLDGGLFQNNDMEIRIGSNGAFKHVTEDGSLLVLDSLNASTSGGSIVLGDEDELLLSSRNTSSKIAANLAGKGWLFLENLSSDGETVDAWEFSGNNSAWGGVIAAFDNGAKITLNSSNAASSSSSVNFGALGNMNVNASTRLGNLDFDNNLNLNIASGKTFSIDKGLTSNIRWLDDSTLKIDGGGTMILENNSGKSYYGATDITGNSTLIVKGDNTADTEYGAYRRPTTLSDGGTIVLDYSGEGRDGKWSSLWNSVYNINGNGGITVYDVLKLAQNEYGQLSYFAGVVDFADDINFTGEGDNQLNFRVDNEYATVKLHSEINGNGELLKTGAGTLVLEGFGEFGSVCVKEGVLKLGSNQDAVNDQLAHSNITINGGELTGWSDSLGTVNLKTGVLNVLKTGRVTLTDSDVALKMDGGTVYVNVLDEDNYTQYVTADDESKVEMKRGAFYVDTATNEADLATGSILTVIETGAGNLELDKSKFLIYDDIAGKRFVIDGDSIEDGKVTLVLKDSKFTDFATSPNESSVGSYLDKWIDKGTMDVDTNYFVGQLENEIENNPHLLSQLTGEVRLSAFNAQVQSHNIIRQTLTQHLMTSPTTGVVSESYSSLRGQANDGKEEGLTGWMTALATFGNADAHNGTVGYDYDLVGGMAGVELGNSASSQFGFYFSYSNLQVDSNSAMGNVKVNDEQFGLYLRLRDDWGYTFASGSLGLSDYDTSRAIQLADYTGLHYKGSTDGWFGSAYLERGFNFELPASTLQPYGGLQYTHLHADDYQEGGSLRTLSILADDTNFDSLQGVLGIRWLKTTVVGSRLFDVNAYTNWTHEFLDASAEGMVSLVGDKNGSIRVIGNSTGRDWIYSGLGGTLHYTDSFSVFGGADVQVNDYTAYVNGHAGLNYTW